MINLNFLGGKQTAKLLGVHQRTLYLWESKNKIETIRSPGGKRFYNVQKYLFDKGLSLDENNCIKKIEEIKTKENTRLKICYARVSSRSQKDDLERQKKLLREMYPSYELIEDVGSGINLIKRGLLKIIDHIIKGQIEELVIVHRDRLVRYGYDLLDYMIKKYSKGKITIINNKNEEISSEKKMVEDVLQIMNVFVAKMNGQRKYKKK
ncbi:site-specific integrase-resolvase [Bodo saltans virus]|uniref:Site-specific integrase-resolvase n=1 Tax=Bodo saltans virus TaxID=2024608 RepID=A0A2H4UVB1_9VIRU|nr:site-specific integrase-resolvase [Bodo saltans virus]ATZ80863.1 site-specific integrase-resolvase [Bodo saltans virus]